MVCVEVKFIFMRVVDSLSAVKADPQTTMIDATSLKTHRTAASLR